MRKKHEIDKVFYERAQQIIISKFVNLRKYLKIFLFDRKEKECSCKVSVRIHQ